MKPVSKLILSGMFVFALAACGGGGGGDNVVVIPPGTPDPIVVDGQCGVAVNQCAAGSFLDIADSNTHDRWQCRGSNGGATAMCSAPKPPRPEFCTDGTSSPLCERGINSVPGINDIPQSQIKATNEEMQEMFVLTEYHFEAHAGTVRQAACNSYTLQCENPYSFAGKTRNADGTVTAHIGSAPYTSLTDLREGRDANNEFKWVHGQVLGMGTAKIVVEPRYPSYGFAWVYGASLPFLVVQSAGNRRQPGDPLFATDGFNNPSVQEAIRENKLLFVAGWDRDSGNNYIRHERSMGCKGADDGCLWAPLHIGEIGEGTSLSAPHVGAALASVLAVFPDTTHLNLAKFAKACAKKSGQGIEVLLREFGGVGVADFRCMGGVTQALANLPAGGRTNVTIDGQAVSVSGRDVTLSFAQSLAFSPLGGNTMRIHGVPVPTGMDGLEFFLNAVPTGGDVMMLVGGIGRGDFFVSAAFGTEDDFFGFADGHGELRGARLTAGHENVFAHLNQTQSNGGKFIKRATGRSLGLTMREEFALTDASVLQVLVQTEKFLGGSAEIGSHGVSFGRVHLEEGDWNHRLSLSSTTEVGRNETVGISSDAYLPESGRSDIAVNVRYRMAF